MAEDDVRRWQARFAGVQRDLAKVKRALEESARSLVMAETRAAALQSENDMLKLQLQRFCGTDIQIGRPLALSEKYVSDNLFSPQVPDADNDKDDFLGSMIYNSIRAKKARAEAYRVESRSSEDCDRKPPQPANNELLNSSMEIVNPARKISSPTVSPGRQAGKEDKAESSDLMLLNLRRDIAASPASIIARNASKTLKLQKSEGKTARALPNPITSPNEDRNALHHTLNSGDEILDHDEIAMEILNQTSIVPHRTVIHDQSNTTVYTSDTGRKTTTSENLPTMKRPFEEDREPPKILYNSFRMSGCAEHSGDQAKSGVLCQGGHGIEGGPIQCQCNQEGCANPAHRRGLYKDHGGKDSTDTSHKSLACSTSGHNLGNLDGPFGTSTLTNTILDTKDKKLRFPVKLYAMLESATNSVNRSAVSWSSSGRWFIIHDEAAFMQNLVSRHFKVAKFCSFKRKLNLWGFKGLSGAWHHKHFARGNVEGLKFICRKYVKPGGRGGEASGRDIPSNGSGTSLTPRP